MATQTPWGKSHNSQKIERGLTFYTTPSHGGFLVSKGYAEKHLSPAALKRGEKWGGYYAFEEDCAAAIVELEIPAAQTVFTNTEAITNESLIKGISRWYPDYLIELGIEPDPQGYAIWKTWRESDRLRAERSPDLIVSAQGVDSNTVKVWTADGSEHLVTHESYQRREGLNLLSKCVPA